MNLSGPNPFNSKISIFAMPLRLKSIWSREKKGERINENGSERK